MLREIAVLAVGLDPERGRRLCGSLAAVGAAVECVPTAAAARARLQAHPRPDVVLVELGEAGTGQAVADLVAAGQGVPVVVFAPESAAESAAALSGGAAEVLSSAAEPDEIARTLRHAVDRARLEAALRERVKELAGLHAIGQTLLRDLPAPDLCREVAAHLVVAMQWPDLCHAVVTIDDAHGDAGASVPVHAPRLTAEVVVDGVVRGGLEVAYSEPDRPFLDPEEQRLLDAAAEAVAGWVQRQDALRQLVRDERRLQGLFSHTTDAMMLANDDGVLVDANPAACELTGYTRDELVTTRVWELFAAPEGTDPATHHGPTAWKEFLHEGAVAGEVTVWRRDGTSALVELRATTGIIPGVHLATMRDVTDRRRVEQALATSESLFRALAETAQDGIYRLRLAPALELEYVNPAFEAITGYGLSDLYEHPLTFVDRTHPDDRDQVLLVPSGPGGATIRVRFQRRDGTWVWLEDRRSVVVEAGRRVGMQGVIRDVTIREQADRSLRAALAAEKRAADHLRAVDDLKHGFLRAISHELRTPLTSVLGFARTLVGRPDLPARQTQELHERLLANATRLDDLIGDLLDLEQLTRGGVELDLEPTDLTALAVRTARLTDVGDRRCVIDETPAPAVVDARKVERIMHNLLANAVKHTPPGSTVWVACRATEDGATITVADDGPGVPVGHRQHVFEPFWQGTTMQNAPSPGTGVGLALVQRFATLHGGRVWVDDRPGGGASFTVSLPANQAAPATS